jgi:outer membrane protein TolC
MLRNFLGVFVSKPWCGWLLLLLMFGSVASAFEPRDVLAYRSEDYLQALERLEQSRQDLRNAVSGFSSFIELKPNVSYGNNDVRNAASDIELDYGLEIDAGVDYGIDWPEVSRVERRNLLRAEDDVVGRLRDDINEGLEFYIAILALQQGECNARAEVERLELEFENAQARFEADEISANDLEGVRIDLDDARLNATDATRTLVLARARIREEYGVRETEARFVAVEFALPAVPVEETFAYREAERELRQLEVEAIQDGYFGILDNIQLRVRYERDQLRDASISVGIDEGVPGAGIDFDYRPFDDNDNEEWAVTLGATIRLDTGTGRDFRAPRQDIELARAELDIIREEYEREIPERLQDVSSARQELQLAIDNFAYIEQRIIESRDELAAEAQAFSSADRDFQRLDAEQNAINEELGQVDARRDEVRDLLNDTEDEEERQRLQEENDALTERRGELLDARNTIGEPRNDAERLRRDLERDVQGTERDLENLLGRDRGRAEDDVFNRFRDYVRRVEDYLDYVDGSWEIIND